MKEMIPNESVIEAMTGIMNSKEFKEQIVKRIRKAQKEIIKTIKPNLNKCVSLGYIKKSEIKRYSRQYLAEYLNLVVNDKIKKKKYFVTNHPKILKCRGELVQKFRIEILNPEEMIKQIEKENQKHNPVDYIG